MLTVLFPTGYRYRSQLVLLVCLFLCACKQTVEMKFDLESLEEDFFNNGFPTDIRRTQNQLDLSGFPRMYHGLTRLYVEVIEDDVAGFTPIMPVYLPLTGPLALDQLPEDDWFFARKESPVQLIDIDENSAEQGRRFPLQVSMTETGDTYRPRYLLQVLPTLGVNLKANNRYALIVTDQVPVSDSVTLQQAPVLAALLRGEEPSGRYAGKAKAVFEPLRLFLEQEGMDASHVIAATVWTTADPAEPLLKAVRAVSAWPAPQPARLEKLEEFPEYCVVGGEWQVPGFQQGTAPFAYPVHGGLLSLTDQGEPEVHSTRMAPFVITIPKRTMPESGFPLVMYNHGTGGDAAQVYQRGKTYSDGTVDVGGGPSEILAQRGWASSGMGGHMALEHMGKLGSLDGYLAYNFLNPRAMRGNIWQMVLERIIFRRLLNQLRIPADLCEQAQLPPGRAAFFFDVGLQAYMGQSLGSYLTGILTAADPDPVQGAVLTGAGGSWIEFVFGPTDPIPLQYFVEIFALQLPPFEHLDRWHPVVMLAEMAMGSADNMHYVERILQKPNKKPPHVLVIEGHNDHQVPENIQRPLVTALGVDFLGDEVGRDAEDSILPYLLMNGRKHLSYPAGGNVLVSGYGARTAVVVRYEEDDVPDVDGHYVSFQLEAPKHQYGCFFEDIANHRVPVIGEGIEQNGACF